jgi:hypothetical protein
MQLWTVRLVFGRKNIIERHSDESRDKGRQRPQRRREEGEMTFWVRRKIR